MIKTIDYILKFGCLFALSIILVVKVGPHLLYKQSEEKAKIIQYDGIEEMKLTLLIPTDLSYMKLNVVLSDHNTYYKIFRIKDYKHKGLFKFLKTQNISTSELETESFPIVVPKQKIDLVKNIQMDADGSNVINKLVFNDYYIVGKEDSIIKNILFVIMGVFFMLLGLLIFVSSINLLITNTKIYQKTGEFPKLWNTIDSKVEAWKYILGGSKDNKNKEER